MRPDRGGAEELPTHAQGRVFLVGSSPALKPLFSRAVRTVAWNAIRGCGCRCRAARRVTPEKSPGRKWTWTSSPQSVGGPRAGETGGGSSGWPRCVRTFRIGPGLGVTRSAGYRRRTQGHSSGNSSPTRAMSFAQAIREVSCERGFEARHSSLPWRDLRSHARRQRPRGACRYSRSPAP